MASEEGTILGRYRLLRQLGYGGIATVHLARDELLAQQVALKIIHPYLRRRGAVLDALRREVLINRRLAHPGVARIFELVEEPGEGRVFLTMEYLPGGDLKTRIVDGGPLPLPEALRICEELLDALGEAHRLGIVHRDIKPQNVLFSGSGQSKLADFGLARCGALFELSPELRVAGTPEYLAPEAVESRYADARSDLYSLGVTLYEMLTGRLPFTAGSPYELLRRHAREEAAPPSSLRPEIPKALDRLVLKALAKEPADRFQTAAELRKALERREVGPEPLRPSLHPCPACGREVLDAFPYCFSCRRELLYLSPAQSAGPPNEVVIVGPGKPGEQLSHELRVRCLGLLKDLAVDTTRLSRKLPRLPFRLLGRLSPEGASALAGRLSELGVKAIPVHRADSRLRREVAGLFRRKQWVMSLRVYAIVFGTMAYGFGNLFRFVSRAPVGYAGLGLVAALLLSIPVLQFLQARRPLVAWGQKPHSPALEHFLSLAPAIRSVPLQALTRRIIARWEVLQRLPERRGRAAGVRRSGAAARLPEALGEEIAEAADKLLETAAAWVAECQGLQDRLEQSDEKELYRRLAELETELAGTEQTAQVQALLQQREQLQRELGARRELERSHDTLMDRLLALSARLDALAIRLASIEAHEAERVLGELRQAQEEAEVGAAAALEVERLG
jgi:serine/threonine protein kinase